MAQLEISKIFYMFMLVDKCVRVICDVCIFPSKPVMGYMYLRHVIYHSYSMIKSHTRYRTTGIFYSNDSMSGVDSFPNNSQMSVHAHVKFGMPFYHQALTHWSRDKIGSISQTIFSNACSWLKMHEYWLKFNWCLFLGVQLTIFYHWFR